MPINSPATRMWLERIIETLNREWDPIGVVSAGIKDEYDSYAGKLASMIRSGASDQQLMDYLEWAGTENMGLGQSSDQTRAVTAKVVAALRTLGCPE